MLMRLPARVEIIHQTQNEEVEYDHQSGHSGIEVSPVTGEGRTLAANRLYHASEFEV